VISPKLVEVGRHLNIELLTTTELLDLEGHPGNFTATVRQQPRFVDLAKCTSCGECAKVCPISLPNEYDEGLSERKAIYKQYPQAIPGAFGISKRPLARRPVRPTSASRVTLPSSMRVNIVKHWNCSKRITPFPAFAVAYATIRAKKYAPATMWTSRWPFGNCIAFWPTGN